MEQQDKKVYNLDEQLQTSDELKSTTIKSLDGLILGSTLWTTEKDIIKIIRFKNWLVSTMTTENNNNTK